MYRRFTVGHMLGGMFRIALVVALTLAGHATAAPRVFYVEPEGPSCAWKLFDIEARTTEVWKSTATCPSRVLRDTRRRRVIFEMEGAFYVDGWDAGAQPQPLGPARAGPWWLAPSGRLRVGHVEIPYPSDATEEVMAAFVRHRGRAVDVLFEGHWYRVGHLPPVVAHPIYGAMDYAIAVVDELADGKWRRIGVAATKVGFPAMTYCDDIGCDDTAVLRGRQRYGDGLFVLEELRHRSAGVIDPAENLASLACDGSNRCQRPPRLAPGFYLLADLMTQSGHQHLSCPVLACRLRDRSEAPRFFDTGEDCAAHATVIESCGYLAIDIRGHDALIVDNETAGHPVVVRGGELSPRLDAPQGLMATWLPDSVGPGRSR